MPDATTPAASPRGSKRTAIREPMFAVVDDFIGAVGLVDVDDIDLLALPDEHATLPSALVGSAAIIEARQRAFMRLGPAWTEPAVLRHRSYLGHGDARRQQNDHERCGLEHGVHFRNPTC